MCFAMFQSPLMNFVELGYEQCALASSQISCHPEQRKARCRDLTSVNFTGAASGISKPARSFAPPENGYAQDDAGGSQSGSGRYFFEPAISFFAGAPDRMPRTSSSFMMMYSS